MKIPKCSSAKHEPIKTLPMLKMEKLFLALEKGYTRHPFCEYTIGFLIKRLEEELGELKDVFYIKSPMNRIMFKQQMSEELADISNLVDFIFEAIQR